MKNVFKKLSEVKIDILISVVLAFVLVSIFSKYFIVGMIPSPSMVPTLQVKDRVLANTKFGETIKGNIYIFNKDDEFLVKRLIAKGGDHVIVKNSDVFVNEILLKEPYVIYNNNEGDIFDIDVIVPDNELFFLGDFRANSRDSRFWDYMFISEDDVVAKVNMFIYPFKKIGTKIR